MKTKNIVLIGLFAAICFIGTMCHIPLNLGGSNTMIHLGTTAIFIAAVFLGGEAGFSAAIGCALFDLINPAFAVWALPTFVIKGLTGYATGKIAFARGQEGNNIKQNIIGFIVGSLVSLIGYFLVNWLVFVGFNMAVIKLSSSIVTSALGVAISIPIIMVLKPAVNKVIVKA